MAPEPHIESFKAGLWASLKRRKIVSSPCTRPKLPAYCKLIVLSVDTRGMGFTSWMSAQLGMMQI